MQKIRAHYIEKEDTQLDALKRLDRKVKAPANVFAYVFGGIGVLVMGSGMSLVMTDIGQRIGISGSMPLGIALGVAGLLMAILNYPLYKTFLTSRRKKYADRVLALSDEIRNA